MEKLPFFRAAMAGLGKYYMGGYGRIGVYRVNYNVSFDTSYRRRIHNFYLVYMNILILSARLSVQ